MGDYSSFVHFLQKIRRPMGIGAEGSRVQMFQILHQCEIIVHNDNKLNFTEVLYSLCERIDGCWVSEQSKVYNKINKQLARKFDLFGDHKPSLGVLLAVTKAQKIWKKKLALKREREKLQLQLAKITEKRNENQSLTWEMLKKQCNPNNNKLNKLEIEIEEPPKPKPPPPSINNEISPRTQKIIKKTKKNENNNLLKSPQPPKEKKKSTKPRPQKKKQTANRKKLKSPKTAKKNRE